MTQANNASCVEFISELYTRDINYRELANDGSTLVTEKGKVNGVTFALRASTSNSISFQMGGSVDAGSLEYDGNTQFGVPLSTDTDYVNKKLTFLVFYQKATGLGELGIHLGIERPFWLRSIQETQFSTAVDVEYRWWQGIIGCNLEKEFDRFWSMAIEYHYSTNDLGFSDAFGAADISLGNLNGEPSVGTTKVKLNRLQDHALNVALIKKFSSSWRGGINVTRQWRYWLASDTGVVNGPVKLTLREPESKMRSWSLALELRRTW